MEEYEAILNYLYESSRIPVWIFENEKIVFTDFSKETLRKEEELKTVFEYFLKNATGGARPSVSWRKWKCSLFSDFRTETGGSYALFRAPYFVFIPPRSSGKEA